MQLALHSMHPYHKGACLTAYASVYACIQVPAHTRVHTPSHACIMSIHMYAVVIPVSEFMPEYMSMPEARSCLSLTHDRIHVYVCNSCQMPDPDCLSIKPNPH